MLCWCHSWKHQTSIQGRAAGPAGSATAAQTGDAPPPMLSAGAITSSHTQEALWCCLLCGHRASRCWLRSGPQQANLVRHPAGRCLESRQNKREGAEACRRLRSSQGELNEQCSGRRARKGGCRDWPERAGVPKRTWVMSPTQPLLHNPDWCRQLGS